MNTVTYMYISLYPHNIKLGLEEFKEERCCNNLVEVVHNLSKLYILCECSSMYSIDVGTDDGIESKGVAAFFNMPSLTICVLKIIRYGLKISIFLCIIEKYGYKI